MRLLTLVAGMFISFSAYSTCLKIGDITTLTGTLVLKKYQSPEDEPKPVTRLVLELDKPLKCVVDVDDTFSAWNKDITILTPKNAIYKKAVLYTKQHVVITGEAILADNAYDFTAILMFIEKIEPYSKNKK